MPGQMLTRPGNQVCRGYRISIPIPIPFPQGKKSFSFPFPWMEIPTGFIWEFHTGEKIPMGIPIPTATLQKTPGIPGRLAGM